MKRIQCKTEICTTQDHAATIRNEIARRAFAIYRSDGSRDGQDVNHWLHAEKDLVGLGEPPVVEERGRTLVLRIPFSGTAPNDLVASIAPNNVLLFGIRDQPGVRYGDSETLLQVISLPFPIIPGETKETVADNRLTLTFVKHSEAVV